MAIPLSLQSSIFVAFDIFKYAILSNMQCYDIIVEIFLSLVKINNEIFHITIGYLHLFLMKYLSRNYCYNILENY